MDSFDKFLGTLTRRTQIEPEWIFSNVAKCMADVVSAGENNLVRLTNDIQVTINRTVFRKVKAYDSNISQVLLDSEDDFVFPYAKLFPCHTLEWLFASTEFFIEHHKEMSSLSSYAFDKIFRVAKIKYGIDNSKRLRDRVDDLIELKYLDWNRTLHETFVDIIEFVPEYSPQEKKRSESFIIELISSISDHAWGSRDTIDIFKSYEESKAYPVENRPSLVMLNTISGINVKAKKREA